MQETNNSQFIQNIVKAVSQTTHETGYFEEMKLLHLPNMDKFKLNSHMNCVEIHKPLHYTTSTEHFSFSLLHQSQGQLGYIQNLLPKQA